MQPMPPNRLGLGLRPPIPSYGGQGPSMSVLAQQQQQMNFMAQSPPKQMTLFVGSISGGITDAFINQLLSACGPLKSFKRLITPANKPQGFGFADFEDPDGALRALHLLNGVELPALEDGCANKKLLIKADEKTRVILDMFMSTRMKTDADEQKNADAKQTIQNLVAEMIRRSQEAASSGLIDKEKYVIPPHLHDLQEADLPVAQRGLVISEIAQFRERAAKKEREKQRDVMRESFAVAGGITGGSGPGTPSGPKMREWGKPVGSPSGPSAGPGSSKGGFGKGAQGYNKPVGFIKAGSSEPHPGDSDGRRSSTPGKNIRTDEELEADRKDARRRDEENSFRDRERRYEPRERQRISALERAIARERAQREAEERDRKEIKSRLDIWDDDESDEMFYIDRSRWRAIRARRLANEETEDAKSRAFEERETENLRRESEEFLARQMDEMQALAEEQRKAGLLLDDGAPVRLNVSITTSSSHAKDSSAAAGGAAASNAGGADVPAKRVFGNDDEEEEDGVKKRKAPLVKLDFSTANSEEKTKERLKRISESVPSDRETLFKAKVRWDGLSDSIIDRKFEPLVKKLMIKYLGELEDDDLVMFVLEHLKDHKPPNKLVEGLEPVLEEEAAELAISIWRQVIFESMAYGEGLHTERMMVD